MKNKFIFFLFFSFIFSGTTGKIQGRVLDLASNPLIGCNISIINTQYGGYTDIDGYFTLLNIPPGNYDLKFSMIGYSDYILESLEVNIDLTSSIDIKMTESSIELESIVVKAKKGLINKNLTSTTAIITEESISKLPVNEVSDILNLQAGYVDGHLRGGRSNEVAYWINGMPMNDSYDGSTIIDVNKDAISEMQLISGAFNAEYGQAMSGIVNITTSDGKNDFGGSVDTYFGDYISNHSDIFMNLNNIDLFSTQNVNLNFHGSIIKDKLFYFLSNRIIYYQGVFEGKRVYNPYSYGYTLEDPNSEDKYWYVLGTDYDIDNYVNEIECNGPINCGENSLEYFENLRSSHTLRNSNGDQNYVPMDWNFKIYSQINLIWKINNTTKINLSQFYDDVEFQDYDRYYKLNPDGNLLKFRNGKTSILKLNKVLNSKSHFNLGISVYKKAYHHAPFEKISDYIHSDLNNQNISSYSFSSGGAIHNKFERNTNTKSIKFDYTNQINHQNQIKIGFDIKRHSIFYKNINLQYNVDGGFNPIYNSPFVNPQVDDISSINTSIYSFNPEEASIYIQDKIELNQIIINLGIRYDYFNPNGLILADPSDPFLYDPIKPEYIYDCSNFDGYCGDNESLQTVEDRLEYWYKSTSSKAMLSPRLGASFPISDKGVFHFSYGHFFQIPKFELLYYNSDHTLDRGSTGNIGVIGNPDLEPEKTISYEMGLQYEITSLSALNMTIYLRDIRDLTGTRSDVIFTHNGATYYQYENSDFAFVKGLVFSYRKNFINGFSFTFDYTFQEAKGTASNPFDAYNSSISGEYPEIHKINLDWDQRHTANMTLYYDSKFFGIGVIGKFGSGLPYTPAVNQNFSNLIINSRKKPITWNLDMRGHYNFKQNQNIKLYINIFNIFDHLNHLNVYNDTGVADRTLYETDALNQNTDELINSVEQWFDNETFYSSPRRVEIGFRYDFN